MKTKTRFHKLTAWLLTLAMLMTFIPSFTLGVSAATEVHASGNLGQGNRTAWTIYDNGLLVIDGKGNTMTSINWDSTTASPWKSYADIITKVSFVNCQNWTSLPAHSLKGFSNLKEVTLPENLEVIQECALGYTAIETIELPQSLKTIGDSAFSNCTSLNYVNIYNRVTTIGRYAFRECDNLKAISIPDSVTLMGGSTFAGCDNLEYVRLGSGISEMPGSAFSECNLLESLTIPANVTTIGVNFLSNTASLKGVYYQGLTQPTTYATNGSAGTFLGMTKTVPIYTHTNYPSETIGTKSQYLNDVRTVTKIDGYFVNVAHTIGGAVKVDKGIVPVGDTVTVGIMAYKNYVLDTFAVTGADGNEITVSGGANTRTFAMPEGDVTITATFKSTIVPHVHSWTFEADGTSINATCANIDGACHNPYQSVVMSMPGIKYFAWSLERTVTVSGTIEDVEIPEVVYTLKSTGEEARPFEPGVYVASLTIEGVTATCEYEITKSNQLTQTFFTYTAPENLTYDGTPKVATAVPNTTVEKYIGAVEVLYNGSAAPPVDVGEYTITLKVAESDYYLGKSSIYMSTGSGRGAKATTITIIAKDIEDLTCTGLAESYPVGATPDVTIQYNGMPLVKDTDYTIEYADNTTPGGTATMTITGKGNYTGTKTLDFEISDHTHSWKYELDGSDTITATCTTSDCPNTDGGSVIIAAPDSLVYTGSAIEAKVTNTLTTNDTVTVVYTPADKITDGKPVNAGTYKASITIGGKTAYVEYTIAKADATVPSGLTAVYGQKLSDVTLPNGWTWVDSTASVGNVGSQTHKANYAGDDNHNAASNVDVTVTVSQSGASMTAYANKNEYTYGEPVTITVNGITPTGETTVNLFSLTAPVANQVAIWNGDTQLTEPQTVAGNALTFTLPTLDVGNYTLTAKFTGNENMAETSVDVSVIINKAEPTVEIPTNLTATYGDTLADVTLPTADNGKWIWTNEGTTSVGDAGTQSHKATFTPTDTTNYKTIEVDVPVEVAKANIDSVSFVVTVPEALADKQTSVQNGTNYTAAIEWNTTDTKFGFNTAYTATVKLTADSNHKFADEISVDGWNKSAVDGVLTFVKTFDKTRKANLTGYTAPSITNNTFSVYHANVNSAIAELPTTVTYQTESGNVTIGIEWSCNSYNSAINETNTFAWTAKDDELLDYETNSISTTGTITVANAAAISVTHTKEDKETTYNGTVYDVSQMFTKGATTGMVSYEIVSDGTGAGTLSGTNLTITKAGTIHIKMSTAADAQYAASNITATLTVKKADGTGTLSMAGWTYGETAKEPAVSDNKGEATYQYKVKGADDSTYSSDKPSDAGEYTVKATFAETDLYNEATATADFTIAKAQALISVVTTPIVKTYGETLELPTATTNFGTVSADKTVADMTNAGSYTVTYKVEGTDNYDGDEKTVSVTINPKPITGATVNDFAQLTYTGLAQTPNATVTIDGLTVTGTWSDVTNVADTTTFTAGGNFIGTIENQAIGMLKAASSVTTEPDANTLTYNEAAQELVTAGVANGGTIKYSFDNTTWGETITTGTNAGSYVVWYKVFGDANHNDTEAVKVDVTIAKKSIEAATVALDGTLTYTGAEQTQNVTVTLDGYAVTFDITDHKATNVKTDGNYTLKVTANGNFEGEKTLEWNIAKATPAPNAEKVTTARVRRGQTLANATVTNGEFFALDGTTALEGTFAWVDDTKEITADSTEKMKFTPTDTNYAEIEIDVAVDSYTTGGGGSSSNTTTTTTKNEDGSTTKTTTNKATGTTTEVTTNTDGSTTTVETKKDGTVTTTEKDKDGNTTTTVENPDGTSTTTEKNKDGSETVVEKDAEGTTTTTEKDSEGNKTVTTEKADGTTTTEETKKDGTKVTTETNADGETTAEVEAKGETEVVIPAPNAEDVTKVVVTDKDGNETEVEFEVKDGGIAISVSGNSTVSVQTGHTCYAKDFTDVDLEAWYHLNVDYVLENGLFKGTTETTFAPNANLTRAMLVTVLYRAEGEPKVSGITSFADLEKGGYYLDAVCWAQVNGIVNGVSETEFAPNDNITREQIAAILYRYAIYKGMDAVNLSENLSFTDTDEISEYAISALNWAVGTGLIKGYEDNTVRPLNNATRAEAAALLQRFIEANK